MGCDFPFAAPQFDTLWLRREYPSHTPAVAPLRLIPCQHAQAIATLILFWLLAGSRTVRRSAASGADGIFEPV
jgi:hypothetical protein